jgi:hypothetical protein
MKEIEGFIYNCATDSRSRFGWLKFKHPIPPVPDRYLRASITLVHQWVHQCRQNLSFSSGKSSAAGIFKS